MYKIFNYGQISDKKNIKKKRDLFSLQTETIDNRSRISNICC